MDNENDKKCSINGNKRRKMDFSKSEEKQLSLSASKSYPRKTKDFLHDYFYLGGDGTAVIYDNGKGRVEKLTYSDLDHGANIVRNELKGILTCGQQEFVGVHCNLGRLYPVLILGILQSGHAFYNINPDNLKTSLEDGVMHLNLKYILVSGKLNEHGTSVLIRELKKVEIHIGERESLTFRVYKVVDQLKKNKTFERNGNYAYAIKTSGTTGQKKTVLVPHSCICPNIDDFVNDGWKVTKDDVIFGSAPPSFDPHIVELFSSLAVGATLVYTTPEAKLNGNLLVNILISHRVTVTQITPTLFRRLYSSVLRSSIKLPCLRIIALGGEKCPEKHELLEVSGSFPNEKFTFQNVYGVTEVSCWASVLDINLQSTDSITLGRGLADTEITLETEPEGEIVISSAKRYCEVIDTSGAVPAMSLSTFSPPYKYRTGDMGTLTSNGIIFLGRKDRVVKRNGMKISLYQIEQMTLSTGLVSYTECSVHEGKIYLVIKLKSEYNIHAQEKVSMLPRALSRKLELPLFMYPDHIISLGDSNLPLNENGKLDLPLILKSFKYAALSSCIEQSLPFEVTRDKIVHTLTPVWRSCTRSNSDDNEILHEAFVPSGGTSISAARFVESAFMSIKLFGSELHTKWEQTLLLYLLDEHGGTLDGVIDRFLIMTSQSSGAIKVGLNSVEYDLLPEEQEALSQDIETSLKSEFVEDIYHDEEEYGDIFNIIEQLCSDKIVAEPSVHLPLEPVEFYTFPLGLCVDASPSKVPFKNQVIIGCHGGYILCIDYGVLRHTPSCPIKAVVWREKLPNRIEATVEVHPNSLYAYVGCHDGKFYKLSVSNGEILLWTSGDGDDAPIRSKCAIYDESVIFLNTNNVIYCVNAHSLNNVWRVNCFKLLATVYPIVFRGKCILSTLNKGIISLDITSGNLLWNTFDEFSSDLIYSSPTLVMRKRKKVEGSHENIFVCTSNKGIEARNVKSGRLHWRQKSSYTSTRVLQPMFNTCCQDLIWIDGETSDSSTLKIVNHETGEILQTVPLPNCGPITPSLVYTRRNNQYNCHLCYKSSVKSETGSTIPYLNFISLHRKEDFGQPELPATTWKMGSVPDFETFSKAIACSEFILFGGRDNNLHVVKLKV